MPLWQGCSQKPHRGKEEALKFVLSCCKPCWGDVAFLGTPKKPSDEKPWIALESLKTSPLLIPHELSCRSRVRLLEGRAERPSCSPSSCGDINKGTPESSSGSSHCPCQMDGCPAAVTRPPKHQLFWGRGKPQGDVDLTSLPLPGGGRGHGQRAAGWRRPREGTRSGQMS